VRPGSHSGRRFDPDQLHSTSRFLSKTCRPCLRRHWLGLGRVSIGASILILSIIRCPSTGAVSRPVVLALSHSVRSGVEELFKRIQRPSGGRSPRAYTAWYRRVIVRPMGSSGASTWPSACARQLRCGEGELRGRLLAHGHEDASLSSTRKKVASTERVGKRRVLSLLQERGWNAHNSLDLRVFPAGIDCCRASSSGIQGRDARSLRRHAGV